MCSSRSAGFARPLVARLVVGLAFFAARPAASQTVTFSGSPAAMKIITAVAGSQPTAVTNTATTYSINNKGPAKKLQAQLNSNMPTGVTLQINLAAITGTVAVGTVTLDNTARTVLTNITTPNKNTLGGITYTLSATLAAGVVTSQTRTVTFTLVNYP